MKIEIHSIKSITARAAFPFEPKTILISIGDTGSRPPVLVHKPEHILRLTFDDLTLEEVKLEYELPESLASSDERLTEFLRAGDVHIFSDEQAQQIANFVLRHNADAEVLICQCHYGQSRSAGCAAAVAEYLYGDGIDIFADDRYYPNKLVYRRVFKALEEYDNE